MGADVEFDETKRTTVLKCDVHGAITKSGDSYRATFLWLLRPLGLDFIDDDFEESKGGLSWDGEVDGAPTSIIIKLTPQEVVYAAWEQPVGHCHGHVWWSIPGIRGNFCHYWHIERYQKLGVPRFSRMSSSSIC